MSKLSITRTDQVMPTEADLEVLRKFLFGVLKGIRPEDDRGWKRFWKMVTTAEAGEMFTLETVFPRNYKFHKKLFALLTVGYDAWEPGRKHKTYKGKEVSKNFERFRADVTVMAGYYEQVFDLKGRMKLEAKSISFASMDDEVFNDFYSAVADVLLREVLVNYKGRAELDSVIEQILGFTR